MEPAQVTLYLIGIVIIIIGAYYATYYIGLKASGQSRGRIRNRNINVIDRFAFSRDKSFCLVEIAGKVYVIGVTNQTMTLLDTLDAAAFSENVQERSPQVVWHSPGGKYSGKMTKRLAAFIAARMGRTIDFGDEADDASFSGSMKTAQEKNHAGQPDRAQAERTADPEENE